MPKVKQCAICKRSKAVFPGIKFVADYAPASFDEYRERKLRGILCTACQKGLAAFPERSLLFQAINYLSGSL